MPLPGCEKVRGLRPPGFFGAGGDLAWRKLIPALYNLYLDNLLPEYFAILGIARKKLDDKAFRQRLREGAELFSRRNPTDVEGWNGFAERVSYLSEDFTKPASGPTLRRKLEEQEKVWGVRANRVFYLAIPPEKVEAAAAYLQRLGVCRDCRRDRLVVEKPFGRDRISAQELNQLLSGMFLGFFSLYEMVTHGGNTCRQIGVAKSVVGVISAQKEWRQRKNPQSLERQNGLAFILPAPVLAAAVFRLQAVAVVGLHVDLEHLVVLVEQVHVRGAQVGLRSVNTSAVDTWKATALVRSMFR